jgi:hypothetical protein
VHPLPSNQHIGEPLALVIVRPLGTDVRTGVKEACYGRADGSDASSLLRHGDCVILEQIWYNLYEFLRKKTAICKIIFTANLQNCKNQLVVVAEILNGGLNNENTCDQHNHSLPQSWATQ